MALVLRCKIFGGGGESCYIAVGCTLMETLSVLVNKRENMTFNHLKHFTLQHCAHEAVQHVSF